jgi:hypothetical protein
VYTRWRRFLVSLSGCIWERPFLASWGLRSMLVVGVLAFLIIRQSAFHRHEMMTVWHRLMGAFFAGVITILTNSADLHHLSFNDYSLLFSRRFALKRRGIGSDKGAFIHLVVTYSDEKRS